MLSRDQRYNRLRPLAVQALAVADMVVQGEAEITLYRSETGDFGLRFGACDLRDARRLAPAVMDAVRETISDSNPKFVQTGAFCVVWL